MFPLADITVYTHCPSLPDKREFILDANYLADFYHSRLGGYKPPRTGRICILIHAIGCSEQKTPYWYNGAICHPACSIEVQKYLSLSVPDRQFYLLQVLHESCIQVARQEQWDAEVFNRAYSSIIADRFKFSKEYSTKLSRDRKHSAKAIVRKSREQSQLWCQIFGPGVAPNCEGLLFEKRNEFCGDSIYLRASKARWHSKSEFGIEVHSTNQPFVRQIFFSLDAMQIIDRHAVIAPLPPV